MTLERGTMIGIRRNHDSRALNGLADATNAANESTAVVRSRGDLYERDREDDQVQSTVRERAPSTRSNRDRPVPAG